MGIWLQGMCEFRMTSELYSVRMYKISPDTDSSRLDVSSYSNLWAFTGGKVHAVGE